MVTPSAFATVVSVAKTAVLTYVLRHAQTMGIVHSSVASATKGFKVVTAERNCLSRSAAERSVETVKEETALASAAVFDQHLLCK